MIYINGKFFDENDAMISIFDHGFLYGDGIFETMRAINGNIIYLDRHIHRLYRSAKLIKLNIPFKKEKIEEVIATLIKKIGSNDVYIRLSVTRGIGDTTHDPRSCKSPTFIVIAKDYKGLAAEVYEKGVKVITSKVIKNNPSALNPMVKSMNFLNNIMAKIEANEKEAYEAIMLNNDGYIAEGSVSNIFFVSAGVIYTPSLECGILDGITRKVVMEIAKENGLSVIEKKITLKEIQKFDECFITNSLIGVLPVSEFDELKMNPSGKITKIIMEGYQSLYEKNRNKMKML